jgi:hypothetical protein
MTGTPNGTVGVAVLGAAGTIVPAIVADLAVSDEVGRMLLFDLDGAKPRLRVQRRALSSARSASTIIRISCSKSISGSQPSRR